MSLRSNIVHLTVASLLVLSSALVATASAHDEGWPDYEIIIWQQQSAAQLAGLARLGVTAGKIFGERGELNLSRIPEETKPFLALHQRWYIENIATDFYATYHRWQPGHPVNWLFDETQRLHRREPENITAFVRMPSLSDAGWLQRIVLRLQQHVQAYAPFRPLYYSLADEPGIADLGAAWDFDFAPQSLGGLRAWLRQRYHTLGALNREWGTQFTDWAAVVPITTDAALQRTDENFAAWADFKEWMDIAFAHAVRAGTDAIHAVDPQARAALEGAQIPGWGGYDYSRLGGAIDAMEMYDSGNNVEITRSLFPRLITLMTSSLANSEEIHRIWHELLLGGRGLILWDEDNALVDGEGVPRSRGQTLARLARELRSGLAAQLIASTPEIGPVAILYSPESFRAQWLLDRKADGKPWAERQSETEEEDNSVRAAMRRASGVLTHLGMPFRWLTREMIERGILQTNQIHLLILPHAIALSPSEAQHIRSFATAGGIVLADSQPGQFDAHGRRLVQPLLADLTGADGPITLMQELQQDAAPGDATPLLRVREKLEKAGFMPRFTPSAPDGVTPANIDIRVFRNGQVTIIGLQREWTGDDLDVGQDVWVNFKTPVYAYDLRRTGTPQHASGIKLTLEAIAPTLIAVTASALPAISVRGPTRAKRGMVATFAIRTAGAEPADKRIVHIEAIAPDGSVLPAHSTNLALRGGHGLWGLSLALDGPSGNWTIRINDVLSGQQIERSITVLDR